MGGCFMPLTFPNVVVTVLTLRRAGLIPAPASMDLRKPWAALNRFTLCFLDPATERDFRVQRAEASRAILRRFILFMVVLVAFAATGIHHKLQLARAAGLPVPPQLDLGSQGLFLAAGIVLVLFLSTLSRRFVPYLHSVTAVCMAGLVLIDNWHARQIPLAYALNGTLLNLVVLYIASQLRFATASVLGIASSVSYLCCIAAQNAAFLESSADLQLQMGVTVTVLVCANLLLIFVTHQRELSARLAYHRARLLEQRGAELEAALQSLQQAEGQLVENERQATVGRLVAGILHEMNTPLGALSSSTQTLERGLRRLRALVLPGARPGSRETEIAGTLAAAERLASVQAASGQRIREVVEGLRQFVALDRAELQVADARAGLETAVALIRPGLPRGVSVRLELPGRPIWVQCFPAKLNQVFLNLLKNAASAFEGPSPQGEIVVSTRVRSGRLQLEVRDTGRGIEPERLPRLFELDFSRQGSRVKLSLGLPSSRGVVEAIGGTLRIESELGRGTLVLIELPLGSAPFARPADAEGAAPAPALQTSSPSSEASAAVGLVAPRVSPML
jgi:signal transduction histidine kinase